MAATHPSPEDRVAIVGAGPAGLFAALALQRLGYQDVTVFEEGDRVATVARTLIVEGRVFDLSTKFVPAATLSGFGMYEPLDELLSETGTVRVPTGDATFYDPAEREVVESPDPLSEMNPLKLLTDFVDAYHLLKRVEHTEGVAGLIASGEVGVGETISSWGARNGVEGFAAFGAYLSDVFSGAPSVCDHAAYMLKSRVHFVGGYLQTIFHRNALMPALVQAYDFVESVFGGEDPRVDLEEIRAYLDAEVGQTNNYILEGGYRPFLERVVEVRGLDVRTSTGVRAIQPLDDGRATLLFDGEDAETYDRVLLACAPHRVATLFPHGSTLRRMFEGHERDHRVRSWLFEAVGWPTDVVGPSGILVDSRNPLRLGTPDIVIDGSPYAVSKEYGDSSLLVTPVYMPAGMTLDEAEERLVQGVRSLGLRVTRVLDGATFSYPRAIALHRIASGWFRQAEALQGEHGLYFLGEAFAGQGVPTIMSHVNRFVPRMFGPVD